MNSKNEVQCRYCGTKQEVGKPHHCQQMRAAGKSSRIADVDDDDFFVSLAVAAVTDDWVLGALAGGNLAGAMVGDMLVDDDDSRRGGHEDVSHGSSSDSSSYDSSSSDSGGGSFD